MSVQVPLFPWSLALLCKLQLKQPQTKDSLLNKVTNISFQYKQYTAHTLTHHCQPGLPLQVTTFTSSPTFPSLSLSLSLSLCVLFGTLVGCKFSFFGSLLVIFHLTSFSDYWGPALTSKRVLNLWPCPHSLSLSLLAALYYAVQPHALFTRASSHSDQVTYYTFLALCCWPYSSRASWPSVIIPSL